MNHDRFKEEAQKWLYHNRSVITPRTAKTVNFLSSSGLGSYDRASNGTCRGVTTHGSATKKKEQKHLTHQELPVDAVRCLLARSLLSLQLGQEAPQYPGLMLHGWLPCTLPGRGHRLQAWQDTMVLDHGSWDWAPRGRRSGRWHYRSCCHTEHFSTATHVKVLL